MLCDLAETYHIYDYKSFPMEYIATLCCGLPSDSRVVLKINNMNMGIKDLMLANIVDKLSLIWWSKTTDGQNNINKPKLMAQLFSNREETQNHMVFASGESFEAKRKQIIEEKKNGRRSADS